jgi:hypothetical protein
MALRRNRFCAMLCVLAVAHAAAVFRCDACESGACGSGRAGCCGGMTAAETQCPLCKAEADSECDGRQAQDSVPCRCAWKPKTAQPMTSERDAPLDPEEVGSLAPPLERNQFDVPGETPPTGGLPRVPIPERPVRILYGVWRN